MTNINKIYLITYDFIGPIPTLLADDRSIGYYILIAIFFLNITAFMSLTSKSRVTSIIYLIAAYIFASIYIGLMGLTTIAIILLMVYVGAIMVLFLFIVMTMEDKERNMSIGIEYLIRTFMFCLIYISLVCINGENTSSLFIGNEVEITLNYEQFQDMIKISGGESMNHKVAASLGLNTKIQDPLKAVGGESMNHKDAASHGLNTKIQDPSSIAEKKLRPLFRNNPHFTCQKPFGKFTDLIKAVEQSRNQSSSIAEKKILPISRNNPYSLVQGFYSKFLDLLEVEGERMRNQGSITSHEVYTKIQDSLKAAEERMRNQGSITSHEVYTKFKELLKAKGERMRNHKGGVYHEIYTKIQDSLKAAEESRKRQLYNVTKLVNSMDKTFVLKTSELIKYNTGGYVINDETNILKLGLLLFSNYIMEFLLAGILLLISLIGATAIFYQLPRIDKSREVVIEQITRGFSYNSGNSNKKYIINDRNNTE